MKKANSISSRRGIVFSIITGICLITALLALSACGPDTTEPSSTADPSESATFVLPPNFYSSPTPGIVVPTPYYTSEVPTPLVDVEPVIPTMRPAGEN